MNKELKQLEDNIKLIIQTNYDVSIKKLTTYDFHDLTTMYGVLLDSKDEYYAFKIEKDKEPLLLKLAN